MKSQVLAVERFLLDSLIAPEVCINPGFQPQEGNLITSRDQWQETVPNRERWHWDWMAGEPKCKL